MSWLEVDKDARPSFWRLFAVEWSSFFRVAVYHTNIVVPSSMFRFLWNFCCSHSGDLLIASVPLLCGLALLSLLWFSAISVKGLQSSEHWKSSRFVFVCF